MKNSTQFISFPLFIRVFFGQSFIGLFISDVITGCLFQIFSPVVYFRFSRWLFIPQFLAGCLLQIFSPVIRLLLTHQSTVDAVACLFAILLLVQPLNWIPGVYILVDIICQLWNAQFIYWFAVFISRKFLFRSVPILFHMTSLPLLT